MGHLLYLIFRCDRRCDGKFGKFENFMELNTPFVSSACALCIGGGLAMSVSSPPSFGEEGSLPMVTSNRASREGRRGRKGCMWSRNMARK